MVVIKHEIKSVVNHYTTLSHVPDIVEISHIADLLSALICVCVRVYVYIWTVPLEHPRVHCRPQGHSGNSSQIFLHVVHTYQL